MKLQTEHRLCDSLEVELAHLRAERFDCSSGPIVVRQSAFEELSRKGLHDPLQALSTDLSRHPEVLPQEKRCEPGGSFRFYPECMYLLAGNWVMAYFDDGMCSGHILLEFSVAKSGAISWKPLGWTPE
jgi:hypothetical protein